VANGLAYLSLSKHLIADVVLLKYLKDLDDPLEVTAQIVLDRSLELNQIIGTSRWQLLVLSETQSLSLHPN
jgi:hypothetical protein